jgi:DNA-binding XRE family transcriptional regulator
LAKNIPAKTTIKARKFKGLKVSAKINQAKIAVKVGSSSRKTVIKLEEK